MLSKSYITLSNADKVLARARVTNKIGDVQLFPGQCHICNNFIAYATMPKIVAHVAPTGEKHCT